MWWKTEKESDAAVLQSLQQELTMEVMLMDRRTNKRASWCAAQTKFEPPRRYIAGDQRVRGYSDFEWPQLRLW